MPSDVHHGEPDPPALCAHHGIVIDAMARHGHVNNEATNRAAQDIHRQCCAWRPKEEA